MPKIDLVLVTLEYPPDHGGVASYLHGLVQASGGQIRVMDGGKWMRDTWPRWWPMVRTMKEAQVRSREQEHDAVMIVSHVFPVGTAAWISRVLFAGPAYAVMFHGLDLRLASNPWKRWLLRRICASAVALIVNSESTKADLQMRVPSAQPTILTPGVDHIAPPTRDEARRALDIAPDEKLVLTVARLVPRKGIDETLRAMGRLQHAARTAGTREPSYVVIGRGGDLRRLEEIAGETRTRVRWVLDADEEEKWRWLAAADVFVLTARDEGTDVEGFGIVYLEAALAGVPSVAGRSGGVPEAVRHERTGLVVDPHDPDAIEGAIRDLLDHPEERARLGSTARDRVLQDFQWKDRWSTLAHLLHCDV